MIIAILGALKAGKIYVPLAPSLPLSRITYMLEDSQAGLVVTDEKNLALAQKLARDKQLLNIAELWKSQAFPKLDEIDTDLSDENLSLSISPDTFAYIIYTSGSTGQPKGVVGRHRDILHEIMRVTNDNRICMEDRQALFTHASVSGSIRDIYGSLLNGAGLFLFNPEEESLDNLANWLIQEKITIYRSVTTFFRQFVSTLSGHEEFPALRLIHLGGEPVYKRDVDSYKKYFSQGCILLNGLGITETGLVCRYLIDKDTQINGSIVPVGYAVDGMEVLLLDNAGHDAGINHIGEIAVRSSYISPGYWRRPDLNQMRFLPDPEDGEKRIYHTGDLGLMSPDGCLIYMGRKDFQVKIRGHRIEVAEIEAALMELDTVNKAVVVARGDNPGDQRLVAYIIPENHPSPTVSSFRRALSERMPNYMIPQVFVILNSLPLTPTGKVDRLALPAPGKSRPELDTEFVAPRSPVEKALAEIWAQVLDLDQVGAQDNFFELGGNSILTTQIASRVITTFHVKIPLRTLFDSPTLADMAVVITQRRTEKVKHEELDQILTELEALSEEEIHNLLSDPI